MQSGFSDGIVGVFLLCIYLYASVKKLIHFSNREYSV